MARRKRGRPISGILLLDKPRGITSNAALQRVRRLFDARKAGHTGSLDPLATGLLPLCFGEATKISGFLLDADKRYEVLARFGVTTDTGDADGAVLAECAGFSLDAPAMDAAADALRGEIQQVPPMYSALKHQGQRLYEIARRGGEVEREARRVVIHELRVESVGPDTARLSVHCSKGTYVRTLVEDLGRALGVGAHVAALRRTGLGPFGANPDMIGFGRLEAAAGESTEALDALLLPVDSALGGWPEVRLTPEMAGFVRQGQAVWVPKAPAAEWLRLYAGDGRFLGMGTVLDDGRIAPRRLLASD